jgi:NAD-dependent DNA ligase
MEMLIKINGGKICSSVTKDCNLLICLDLGDKSSKLNKALQNNVKIITYEEAIKLFKNH